MTAKIGALAAVVSTILAMGAANAAGVVVPNANRYAPFSETLPNCGDPGVLDRIRDRFAQKEIEYWSSSLTIGNIDRIAEIGYRANGLAYIPRRYCVARAAMNDGRLRTVEYQVQADLGIIGWTFGVEWCVVGLDRDFAYAPACSALRPFVQRRLAEMGLKAKY